MHWRALPSLVRTTCLVIAAMAVNIAQAQLVGIQYDTGKLYNISTIDASATFVADTGLVGASCLARAPSGDYYSFTSGTNAKLYKVNVGTGAKVLVGALGLSYTFEGGMAFDGQGNAYATNGGDAENPSLVKINLGSGAATVVGRIGASGAYDVNGLVYDTATNLLVGINREANNLLFISPTDASIGIGPTYDPSAGGPSFGAVGDMCNVGIGPFAFTYFCTAGPDSSVPGDNSLWSMDIQTMTPTLIHAITGVPGVAERDAGHPNLFNTGISGLAPVPEPTSIVVLSTGILFVLRRRLRK